MKPIVATLVVGTALAFSAFGADIYVWTDENGKTHLADSVPPKYKASAQRIDSRQFELTPEQRREADARLELARRRSPRARRRRRRHKRRPRHARRRPQRRRVPRATIARPCSGSTTRASSASRRSSTPTARSSPRPS
jgi:hypothetical protein